MSVRSRRFGAWALLLLLMLTGGVGAQPRDRPAIIVVVGDNQAGRVDSIKSMFLAAMRERGLQPGELASVRFLVTAQDTESLQRSIGSLRRDSAGVVYLTTFLMLKHMLPIQDRPPIAFYSNIGELLERLPVLANPAIANATGINGGANIEAKMLELLSLANERLRSVCAVTSAVNIREEGFGWLKRLTAERSLALTFVTVDSIEDLSARIAERAFDACDGLLIFIHTPLMNEARSYIAKINSLGRPAVYESLSLARHGALVTIEPERELLRQHLFDQIVAILRGTPLAKLPIVTPDSFAIGINVPAIAMLSRPPDKRLILRATRFFYD